MNIKKVYIISPSWIATGGTELLHQLCEKLLSINIDAYLYYVGDPTNNIVKERFFNYKKQITNRIEDLETNLLIAPESLISELYHYKHIQKSIWWLSVDNYQGALRVKLDLLHYLLYFIRDRRLRVYEKKWIHFTQSQYAYEYVIKERNVPKSQVFMLSDYLNGTFFENASLKSCQKKDIVLYNPKKGVEFTKGLMEHYGDIIWKPLINMTPEEMKNAMAEAKVYIDFGNHPGKDRIPREAAVCKCCIITGVRGAACNDIDINIPAKYKFKDNVSSYDSIYTMIKECIVHYSERINDFETYRESIYQEENRFVRDINEFFAVRCEKDAAKK